MSQAKKTQDSNRAAGLVVGDGTDVSSKDSCPTQTQSLCQALNAKLKDNSFRANPLRPRIVYAFPTIGKSYSARRLFDVIDADIGDFKKSRGYLPKDRLSEYSEEEYAESVLQSLWRHSMVFTNHPRLAAVLACNAPAMPLSEWSAMVLPSYDCAEAIKREASRNGPDSEFKDRLGSHFDKWLVEWRETASVYQIPVYTANFLIDVMADIMALNSPSEN